MAPVCDGAAMIHRKGEITKADLQRGWPHHVVLPANKLRAHEQRDCAYRCSGFIGSVADVSRASWRSRICCVLLYQASKRRCFF